MRYRLVVKVGYYESDSLFGLLWEVFKHRLHHWRNGEGWVD
jgi:hypothetical protein